MCVRRGQEHENLVFFGAPVARRVLSQHLVGATRLCAEAKRGNETYSCAMCLRCGPLHATKNLLQHAEEGAKLLLRALAAGRSRLRVEGEVLRAKVAVQFAVGVSVKSLEVFLDVARQLTLADVAVAAVRAAAGAERAVTAQSVVLNYVQ